MSLGEVGEFASREELESIDVVAILDENDGFGSFSHRPDDFVVPFMPDQNDGVMFLGERIASKWTW